MTPSEIRSAIEIVKGSEVMSPDYDDIEAEKAQDILLSLATAVISVLEMEEKFISDGAIGGIFANYEKIGYNQALKEVKERLTNGTT